VTTIRCRSAPGRRGRRRERGARALNGAPEVLLSVDYQDPPARRVCSRLAEPFSGFLASEPAVFKQPDRRSVRRSLRLRREQNPPTSGTPVEPHLILPRTFPIGRHPPSGPIVDDILEGRISSFTGIDFVPNLLWSADPVLPGGASTGLEGDFGFRPAASIQTAENARSGMKSS